MGVLFKRPLCLRAAMSEAKSFQALDTTVPRLSETVLSARTLPNANMPYAPTTGRTSGHWSCIRPLRHRRRGGANQAFWLVKSTLPT